MKYFLHDSTAFSDEKITLLYLKFGFEAIGLFFTILEKLALQEQPINETVLKSQLNIKKRLEKQLNFMYEIDILSVKNGDVFSKNILKFSEKYQIKKEKTRKRVSEWRNNQANIKNVTSYKSVRNAPKDKISKDNINKERKTSVEIKNFTASLSKLFPENITSKLTDKDKWNWIDTVDKLIRIDKFTNKEIEKAVKSGRNSEFWNKQFLSISKLRKKNKDDIKYINVFLNLNGQVDKHTPKLKML